MAPMPIRLPRSREFNFQGGDARVGIAVADHAQAGGLLAEHHADVLGAAEPDADDRGLAGEPALAELISVSR